MTKHLLRLTQSNRQLAHRWVDEAIQRGNGGKPWMLEVKEPTRSLEQNRLMWPCLSDISRQVTHQGVQLEPEDWKTLFMHSLFKETRVMPDLDGTGFVALTGYRSSHLSVEQFSDLIELIYQYGAKHGVKWSRMSRDAFEGME